MPREGGERVRRLRIRFAVVDHDRKLELLRELEMCVEEPALLGGRRMAAYRVETGLADRDRLRMREQLAELVDPARLGRRRPDAGRSRVPHVRLRAASAIRRAARHESIPVPMVTMRVTPASCALSTRAVASSSHASRCACESVTP